MNKHVLSAITGDCDLSIIRYEPVRGGDINHSYCLSSHDKKYFLKINDSLRFPGMFEKEGGGLNALRKHAGFQVPIVIKHGIAATHQYLLLEWIETGDRSTGNDTDKTRWTEFGRHLAELHKTPMRGFGWEEDNYIGSLVQFNDPREKWDDFYTQCRILPLTVKLFNTGSFRREDLRLVENLCTGRETLFPTESPALLHGDLWSGNFMFTIDGQVALVDPAVYRGHREMDIGTSLLFGGFDPEFYRSYNEAYPLEAGWEQRLPLSQLYPMLVHAILFGGHYIDKCLKIIKRYN